MGLKRVSEAKIDERKAAIGKLNTRIERWEVLAEGREKPFWKDNLGLAVKKGKEACEKEAIRLLLEGTEVSDNKARVLAGMAAAYAQISTDVEDAEKKIEKAQDEISLLRQDIKRAKDNGGLVA